MSRGRTRKKRKKARKAGNVGKAAAVAPFRSRLLELREDVERLGRLFARGYSILDVKAETGWGKSKLEARMRQIRRIAIDKAWAWSTFLAAARADLQAIDTAMWTALRGDPVPMTDDDVRAGRKPVYRQPTAEQHRVAIMAALAKERIRRDIIEVGQSLGIYDAAIDLPPEQNPARLGFFREEDEDALLPAGNRFDPNNGRDVEVPPPPIVAEEEPEKVH